MANVILHHTAHIEACEQDTDYRRRQIKVVQVVPVETGPNQFVDTIDDMA